ncbi:transglutaminase family protein [Microbacterium sediminis]|uniref:Transglutaminase n=1 Tax=Microbacterium sediminis TaxID=904291 RepID=A0A1B9NE14_9MICO|nr:transglutaminase family protein [Microbacterium sediminis]OCG74794.1 transglutaminase [Microbacterium sediminis]QBR75097.1 transglutaminase family protein [Microbacterium sediminis]
MKRLRIEHQTGFRYMGGEVTASYNEARMLPVTCEGQFVLMAALDISPHTAVSTYVDYFGTQVSAFDVLTSHDDLTIVARSLVEVRARGRTEIDTTWEALRTDAQSAVDVVEMLQQTDRTRPHPEVAALAHEIAARHENPDHAALEIATTVGEAMEYVFGVTTVQTTAAEAWTARTGVCQDITHVALGALRAAGIPARYVSGYLHPQVDPVIGETVAGESHAWVEWFAGGTWQAFDATNGIDIGDRHVLVARGRDYEDVPPLRGVYSGSPKSELHVTVTITREA